MRDLAELARHDPLYAQAKKEAYNTDPGVLPRTTYFNFKLFWKKSLREKKLHRKLQFK